MDFQIKKFKSFNMMSWDNLLIDLEGPIHNCTWNNLNYYSAYDKITNNSFAIFHEKKLVAIVPIAINSKKKINYSFGNNLIFSPIFASKIRSSLRKKTYDYIFTKLKKELGLKKLKLNMQISPLYFENKKFNISSKNQFELLAYSKKFVVHNTLIVNLNENEEQLLLKMSKYHRKNISKTSKIKNLEFKILNYKKPNNEIKMKFNEFKKYHKISAGRITRPKKTWDIMLKKIYDNEAELFFLSLNNKAISYLYCAKYFNFSWGWSQVNLKEYEYMSPRHYLEWNAMKYYKNNNHNFYEIGERYFEQNKFRPTAKEISITEFKEKYGSDKYPKVILRIEF